MEPFGRPRAHALDLSKEIRRGTSVYNGIFNLLVLNPARDWITGQAPKYDDLDDHHIVPKAWGNAHDLHAKIDTILNRTPLTSDTNRNVIRDRLPNAYLPELMQTSGEDAVRTILASHFISATAFDILLRDPFTPTDFEEFTNERQRTLLKAIEDLLVKERLSVEPGLRALDARVEEVELELRRLIDTELAHDETKLPPHILVKLEGRLRSAARTNPALRGAASETLAGLLEYADLRELQDVLLGKAVAPIFRERFPSPDLLVTRFDQLTELRNAIRHSRTASQITRKDGEAAPRWFSESLSSGADLLDPLSA